MTDLRTTLLRALIAGLRAAEPPAAVIDRAKASRSAHGPHRRFLCGWCWTFADDVDDAGVCAGCQLTRGRRG
jgi:hypothetical protein